MSKAQKVHEFVPQRLFSLEYPSYLDQPGPQWISFRLAKNPSRVPAAFMASSGEAKELVSGKGKLNLLLIRVKVEAIWLGNYCFPCPWYTS